MTETLAAYITGITSIKQRAQQVEITADFTNDFDTLLHAAHLDPSEWLVARADVVGDKATTRFVRRFAQPAAGGSRRDPLIQHVERSSPLIVAVLSDQQTPGHDPVLHELACRYLARIRPHILVVNGDLLDLPSVGKYRRRASTPDWSVQDCVDSGYALLADYASAAPRSQRYMLPGNHEERLQTYMLEEASVIAGLKLPGGPIEIHPVVSVPSLLRLESLGYKWVSSDLGEWPYAELSISPHLSVTHGWIVREGSGVSGLKTLRQLQRNVVIGHTHRQSLTKWTVGGLDGSFTTYTAAEGGTMARYRGGLGYTRDQDWQLGFTVATVYNDGATLELASFDGEKLFAPRIPRRGRRQNEVS